MMHCREKPSPVKTEAGQCSETKCNTIAFKLQNRSLAYVSLPFSKLSCQAVNPVTEAEVRFSFQRPRMVLISSLPPTTSLETSSSSAL